MATQGELNLQKLLQTMSPILHPETFVFMTFPPAAEIPAKLHKQMIFMEAEGATVISTLSSAKEHGGVACEFPSRMITLQVHSSLEAVGFLAVVTSRLAKLGMGVNPVSGFRHDHLFVPAGRADEAMGALGELVREANALGL